MTPIRVRAMVQQKKNNLRDIYLLPRRRFACRPFFFWKSVVQRVKKVKKEREEEKKEGWGL